MVFKADGPETGAAILKRDLMKLTNFLKDESGTMIIYWLLALIGILFIIVAYAFVIPLGNILINVFVINGAPIAQMMWIRTATIWGFSILGVVCLLIAFMASYKRTYDQGIYRNG